ncbi:helix-turn-helix domain-containing protein [Niallia sp. MER 6]|uniref:helix-turn-helix domain-containing protein n=1 Tax=Niallia sp. MER 6 TaxID=2939567 RepID=UPI002041568E|nr:helix-turn-helix transcriptional regulator [Niallia sp. MER 6]MCM3032829.1 helix-turn-helix domain-containing protein [Niallia sp. MER 6]
MYLTADEFYKIRKVYRLTQTEVGALCEVSPAYINMIEKGSRNLSERVKRRLITELKLTPEKLARILAIYEETNIRGI